MYETMNEEMKESIRTGRLETMTPEDFSKLTTSFFLLISVSTGSHIIVNVMPQLCQFISNPSLSLRGSVS
jgi:hypothetical protein